MSIGAFSFIVPVLRRNPAESPTHLPEAAETPAEPVGDGLPLPTLHGLDRNQLQAVVQPEDSPRLNIPHLLQNLGRTA
ncbi:MAG: hypothetical protein K1Y36_08435 [Blastocatellia bacterium]|nr:hypothetical protein [Blastocatellia bacterium]